MGQQKRKRSKSKKLIHYNPDRNYIKNAVEEFESRGGRINRLSTGNSFDKKMMFNADMDMEPNQDIAEIVKHEIHQFSTLKN